MASHAYVAVLPDDGADDLLTESRGSVQARASRRVRELHEMAEIQGIERIF